MIRILFLAANPTDQLRLQSRREFDQLRHALDAAPHGRRFTLIQEFAVAADGLQELLVRHQPQIVHFSGHGAAEGLLFEAADGRSQRVAPHTLRNLFAGFRQTVCCVVLNACYSQYHADAIATVIDSVVGMSDALTDDAALAFATAFYRALANGATLVDAVALGRNQLDLQNLDEAHKPHLIADRINASQVRALDWNDDTPTTATTASPTTINSDGGTVVGHDVQIAEGDFINRDKIIIQQQTNIYQTVTATNQSVAGHESVVFIPFLRKSATEFVGRDAELVELHEKLQQSQMVGVRPVAALTGLGGIGKTQLAVEYAYRYQASYPGGIYWINAADLNRVRSGLVETAERMGLRTDYNTTDNALLAGLVKRCQQQPATLLCFDNVPDAEILWQRLIRELNTATLGAAILVTTRRRELPPTMAALDLRRLSDNTVRQLLGPPRPDLLIDPDLPRLLKRLGGLPLVVSLVANALQNSPDATIADYLAALAQHGEETVHEALDARVADYDLYREVYTRTLLPVLREQWERLCQQPKSENAQLLLRIAGQLPEAAEIPIARLGLLAGLQDEKVIKPLTSAVNILWKLALVEELKADAIRLHPLVHNFAESLTTIEEHEFFRIACAGRLASAFYDIQRLGLIYEQRGISSMILDLLAAIEFCRIKSAAYILPDTHPPRSRPSNKGTLTSLYNFLHIFRYNAHHLQGSPQSWRAERLWQQLLLRTPGSLTLPVDNILQQTPHWLLQWKHQRQSLALEQTLVGHKSSVCTVAVVDDQCIVSASIDGTIKVWNLITSQVEQTLIGHEKGVNAVKMVDDQRIVSASADGTIKVWNRTTGQVEQTLLGHKDEVLDVAVVEGYVISSSFDGTIKVWNLHTGALEQTLVGHKRGVRALAVVDRQRIVSASDDHTLKVWNLHTGALERTLTSHELDVNTVAVVDGQRIVSASDDHTLKIWNLHTGILEQTLTGHGDGVFGVAVVDGKYIISASFDRTLKIWNLHTGSLEQTLVGHESGIYAVAVVDGQRIISASDDHTLKVWNIHPVGIEQTFVGHEGGVRAITVVDRQRIVSASGDPSLRVWNLHTGSLEQTLIDLESGVHAVAVVNEQRIVSASFDRTIKVWNIHTGELEQTLAGHKLGVSAVAVMDECVISASFDHTIKIWNLRTGELEQTLVGHERGGRAVAVIDGQRIVSASFDRTIKIWNIHAGTLEQTLVGHERGVRAVAVVDEQRIVSASDDCTLKVWSLHTGTLEQTLVGHELEVSAVAVLNSQRVVSASDDRTLKVWNLQTGQVITSVGLDGALQCVVVSRQSDRTLVVTGDAGGALYCLELVEPVDRTQ